MKIETGKILYSDIFSLINLKTLFRTRWGFEKKEMSDSNFNNLLLQEAYPAFDYIVKKYSSFFSFNYVYSFLNCNVEDSKVIINDKIDFVFPRQKNGEKISLADFFKLNIMPVFVVSINKDILSELKKLKNSGEFKNYFFLNGICAELTDIAAEFLMKNIYNIYINKYKLSFDEYKVCRFSFGYPACPELEYQKKLFDILKPEKIGVTLTSTCLMEPEFSVSAIVAIAKEVRYFNMD